LSTGVEPDDLWVTPSYDRACRTPSKWSSLLAELADDGVSTLLQVPDKALNAC
jgi:hypothetical protein